ncbi:MAG: SLC13 family permease [Acidobacteriota bacterium]|nr:SLC13 family permease [Acidobacteriota bacterium]MDH3523046.1 SLC13 family permease [Acidobacteriota bacterium]
MTLEIGFLFALLVAMVYLFLTEKLPVDLTAFLGLVVLIFGGYLTAGEAFTGFASPAVITMLSVFIVGAALLETGVADLIGGRIHSIVGDSEVRLIVVLMLVAGVLSAFMNNIAATAVLMPAVASIARRAGLAPGRLFMPLAFGAILGGTTTLVGTPPNILAAQMLSERGLTPFSLFDFTPIGAVILAVGTIFMVTVGRKLLPAGEARGPAGAKRRDLASVYQLQERLFSVRIPAASPLDGKTLGESRFGNALRVKVLAIVHKGKERLAPQGDAVLRAGDVLTVTGSASDLEDLLQLRSLDVERTQLTALPTAMQSLSGVRARLAAGSPLTGHSLREMRFHERYGLVVLGIRHEGELHRTHLAEEDLLEGDEILALGEGEDLPERLGRAGLEVLAAGPGALAELQDQLCLIGIPKSSPLAGSTIAESRLGELLGLTIVGLIRGDDIRLGLSARETLAAGDRLLITAEPSRIERLVQVGEIELEAKAASPLESEDVGMVEVAVAPRSGVVGRTLTELDFRDRYGLLALALWREGRSLHVDFSHVPLRFGDALLLHGPRTRIQRLAEEPDFVVLSDTAQAARRTTRAPFALGCLLLMIGLVASGLQPIHVAAFTAASLAILFGTLTMQQAYRAIEWKAIFLVAAVLPVGMAMERTGAALLLAKTVATVAGPAGDYATLAALVLLASLLSQGLDGAPAVVLLAPVIVRTAEAMGTSPYPLMMGVGLAASAAFMTPFSHKANLLVMGAGGYRSSDYLKVGTPLTVVLLAIIVVLVPFFFPF